MSLKDRCTLNEIVIDIIRSQYQNRSKLDVSNFLKELLYQDETVQQLTEEYKETLDDNLFFKLIYYLGLSDYLH